MTEKQEYDKLPVEVEAPGFKKGTGEFTFLLVIPKKYEEYAMAFMPHVSSAGVVFFKKCEPADMDSVMGRAAILPEPVGMKAEGESEPLMVDVRTLSEALDVTEKTVQNYVNSEPPIAVRMEKGEYDLLASYVALYKAYQALQRIETERILSAKARSHEYDALEKERKHREKMGQLLPAERTRQVYEKIEAEERQSIINMPKLFGAQFGPEVEIFATDWSRRHLSTFSSWDAILGIVRNEPAQKHQEAKKKKAKRK